MIPIIPKQREFASNASKPFNDLIAYIEGKKEQDKVQIQDPNQDQEQKPQGELFPDFKLERTQLSEFDDLINYATAKQDKSTQGEKCIAIRTHGVNDLSTG